MEESAWLLAKIYLYVTQAPNQLHKGIPYNTPKHFHEWMKPIFNQHTAFKHRVHGQFKL